MNRLAQEAAIENVGVGSDDLKDKTNAKTNQFAAAARKPVREYRLARLGSPSASRSHIGRRGAPDRISAVDCWRNRVAESPGEQTIRLLFEAPQRLRRIRLLFREEKEARTQEFVLRWSPTADGSPRDIVRQQYHFSPSGATEEIEEYRVEFEDVTALELSFPT
jgi:hypothetical protein